MGNSEVGHLTIGSGRVLDQDFQRVNRAVADGSLFENEALVVGVPPRAERGGNVHLLGLVSHGGVHSHIDHLRALLELAAREGMAERTWIHAFTDGRDVSPTSAVRDLAELPDDRIATIAGRYYAMDRDKRWERTQLALDAIVQRHAARRATGRPSRSCRRATTPASRTSSSCRSGVDGRPALDPARDAAICFNFRPDRMRQLAEKLGELGVDVTTMTKYRERLRLPGRLPGAARRPGARRGAREPACASCTWPRPRSTRTSLTSSTAAARPSRRRRRTCSSRRPVTCRATTTSRRCRPSSSRTQFVARIGDGYGFAVINFANPDMVGHTGVIPAVVRRSRRPTPASAASSRRSRRSAASASSPPTTATPSRCSRPTG